MMPDVLHSSHWLRWTCSNPTYIESRPALPAGAGGVHHDAVGIPSRQRRAGGSLLLARLAGLRPQRLSGLPALLGLGGAAGSAVGAVPRWRQRGGGRVLGDVGLELLKPGAQLGDQDLLRPELLGLGLDEHPEAGVVRLELCDHRIEHISRSIRLRALSGGFPRGPREFLSWEGT